MIKAILFDFYGTLVEEDDLYIDRICTDIQNNASANITIREIGVFWYERFLSLCNSSYGGNYRTQRDIELQSLQDTIQNFDSSSDAEKLSHILFSYWSSPNPFDSTQKLLNSLSLPTCVVSNIDNEDVENALAHISYEPDYLVTSETEKSYKPRTEMFEKALELLRLQPSEVVHIGDSYTSDIESSNLLGIKNIWMNPLKRVRNGDSVHDYEVSDIQQVQQIIESHS